MTWPAWIEAISTLIYAGVTIFALIYLISQAKAAHRQADILGEQIKLMIKSITLQEVVYAQWIDTRDWQYACEIDETGTYAKFTFEIFNPTCYPLTLREVEISVSERPESATLRPSCLLPPNAGFKDAFVRAWLYGDDLTDFNESTLAWEIKAKATFTDVLYKSHTQEVGKLCIFSKGAVKFHRLWAQPEKE